MNRTLNFALSEDFSEMRIDTFLRLRGFSGTILGILRKDASLVRLDGRPSRVVDRIGSAKELTIEITETEEPTKTEPEDIPLSVIFEDEDILIVDKSSDMAIYPSPATPQGTLCAACMAHFGKDAVFRPVNRLDRHTSGLVLIAKNRLSACVLTDALHTDGLERIYLAAAEGLCPDGGTIDAPIGRDESSILLRKVSDDGQRAVTHYERLLYQNGYSLVKIRLETGRTHQIRVHMKHLGHPLPGDFLYNPDYSVIDRPALHSWRLSFVHPVTREQMSFTAPLPGDIKRIFGELPADF